MVVGGGEPLKDRGNSGKKGPDRPLKKWTTEKKTPTVS